MTQKKSQKRQKKREIEQRTHTHKEKNSIPPKKWSEKYCFFSYFHETNQGTKKNSFFFFLGFSQRKESFTCCDVLSNATQNQTEKENNNFCRDESKGDTGNQLKFNSRFCGTRKEKIN